MINCFLLCNIILLVDTIVSCTVRERERESTEEEMHGAHGWGIAAPALIRVIGFCGAMHAASSISNSACMQQRRPGPGHAVLCPTSSSIVP